MMRSGEQALFEAHVESLPARARIDEFFEAFIRMQRDAARALRRMQPTMAVAARNMREARALYDSASKSLGDFTSKRLGS